MAIFKKFLATLLILSIVGFIICYFLKDRLPKPDEIIDSSYLSPKQSMVNPEAFIINKDEFTYHITPKYNYEINGLVVSYHYSKALDDLYHRNDPLNSKDICLFWGNNLKTDVYEKMQFSSGEWSCSFQFKSKTDSSWFNKFTQTEGSNNHLLPKNDEIDKKIQQAPTPLAQRRPGFHR